MAGECNHDRDHAAERPVGASANTGLIALTVSTKNLIKDFGMSKQRIKIPRASDRTIDHTFRLVGKQFHATEAQVSALGCSPIGAVNLASDPAGDWLAILNHDSYLIENMHLQAAGLSITFVRGGDPNGKINGQSNTQKMNFSFDSFRSILAAQIGLSRAVLNGEKKLNLQYLQNCFLALLEIFFPRQQVNLSKSRIQQTSLHLHYLVALRN